MKKQKIISPRQNRGIGADPNMSADLDGSIVVFPVHGRVQVMVDGGKDYIVSYQHTIPDLYPALILEVTAGVDEHIPSDGNVFPEVRIERGEQAEGRINFLPGQPSHDLPDLLRGMVLIVQLHSQPDGLLARVIKNIESEESRSAL